jgi:tetratricopeptide (TPR) repeat protein
MTIRTALLAVAVAFSAAATAGAQTVAEHVALGDRAYTSSNAAEAYKHYQAALAADPRSYEALWKASREAVDLGEFEKDTDRRGTYFSAATALARRAVAANPQDAEGHFHLARSLGRTALAAGKKDKVKYATEVRAEALKALQANPRHAGALHVMGVWNAEVMRLGGMERWAAKNLLGGKVFDSANWNDAVNYMERAVAVEPAAITHHLDLAKIYRDTGNKAKAREQFQFIVNAPATEANDANYKREAVDALRKI